MSLSGKRKTEVPGARPGQAWGRGAGASGVWKLGRIGSSSRGSTEMGDSVEQEVLAMTFCDDEKVLYLHDPVW